MYVRIGKHLFANNCIYGSTLFTYDKSNGPHDLVNHCGPAVVPIALSSRNSSVLVVKVCTVLKASGAARKAKRENHVM